MSARKTAAARASADARSARSVHWRQILSGSTPREVLARLVADDPLELRRRVAAVLRARSYLFDADRVYLRAAARCARFAVRYRGQPALDAWLTDRVEEALLDLLQEDLEAERLGEPLESFARAGLEDLAGPLELDAQRMRAVCVAVNHRPEPERRAFFALVIEGRSLDELAGDAASAPELARRARGVLEVALAAHAPSEEAP